MTGQLKQFTNFYLLFYIWPVSQRGSSESFLIMLYVNIRQHVVLSILHIFSEIEISYMYDFFCWCEEQGCNGLQKTIEPSFIIVCTLLSNSTMLPCHPTS